MLSGIAGRVSVADQILGIAGKLVGGGSGSGNHRIMARNMMAVLIAFHPFASPLWTRFTNAS